MAVNEYRVGETSSGREAVGRGFAALDRDAHEQAHRWFERARRLAPADPALHCFEAAALAVDAPDRAIARIETLTAAHPDSRDVHALRIAVLHRLARAREAAGALDALLNRFAPPRAPAFAECADAICAAAGHDGWIGAHADGVVVVHARLTDLRLGRRRVAPPPCGGTCQLPHQWRRAGSLVARPARGRVLGARIDLAAIGAAEGAVSVSSEPPLALEGWARYPADPDLRPVVEVALSAGGP